MIRILTLLVSLFSFGLVQLAEINYEIPVTDMLYFNDTPIEELNGLTLNQLFIDNNIEISGIVQQFPAPTAWSFLIDVLTYYIQVDTNDIIYISKENTDRFVIGSSSQIPSGGVLLSNRVDLGVITFNRISNIYTASNIYVGVYADRFRFSQGIQESYKIININLTDLGLTSLTKSQLDRYYELWLNPELNITYQINELDTQDLVLLLASQSVWTIMIHLLYKYAYRPKKKSKRLGM
jgi:hypothetical protein